MWDLRVETIVAELIDNEKRGKRSELQYEDIVIKSVGAQKRGYAFDVLKTECIENEVSKKDQLHIEISREGLYDALPEGLFHPLRSMKSVKEMIKEIKRQNKSEKDARKFFLPLEYEFFRERVLLEIEERKTLLGFINIDEFSKHLHRDLVFNFWGLSEELSTKQIAILLHLLPLAYRIVGNPGLTELCFETILEQTIKIKYAVSGQKPAEDADIPRIGEARLAKDFILGDTLDDGVPNIEVVIGPVPRDSVIDYLPILSDEYSEGKGYKILNLLYGFFFPAEADIKTSVLIEKKGSELTLSNAKDEGRLGYTSYL
jgi:hypothetical protein